MDRADLLNNVRVVLSHTSHPGNIGAAARAMKTMGLSRLVLINPKQFPDPQADAMSAGATDILEQAQVCATLDEALQGCVLVAGMSARVRDISQEVLPPREAVALLTEQAMTQSVALLFGTEMSGLTNEEAARCQVLVRIPCNPDYSSLNLAAAVQLLSYEMRLAAGLGDCGAPALQPAPVEQVERLFEHMESTLVEIGFLNHKHPTKLMHKLRRLYARARLEQEEINILRGILTVTQEYHANKHKVTK
ncbi:tRNA (cytidine/uridine-2'-O-)-methyltransferase TrmJ [Ferriphaselus amnicola]|uniref:tRNA (cytidine/uridine-2'-O-)-methyltransferase TrmJ n=1 Tax=Ferriphaselus amnicola TaxID=1188319 RepID=A0A2Z6GCQ4_9PROT|nr:RNA methyltransferase [Ferriphaselus amnicola]BBE51306.1 tRNA (cytidine/uridine-2'-O-)-methyltransferase TrmJ [Ferriphaselus amnicola]